MIEMPVKARAVLLVVCYGACVRTYCAVAIAVHVVTSQTEATRSPLAA
jgi:hypothetical protein